MSGWDGKGWPGKVAGDDVPVASRIVQLAEYVEVAYRSGGTTAVRDLAERRSGSQFDPKLEQALCDHTAEIFEGLAAVGTWHVVIDAEPTLAVLLSGSAVDRALQAIAELVDLKSPCMLGHSVAVADLAAAAGRQMDLGAADAYQAMREERPYRPALPATAAAAELRSAVRAGLLDADAVDAVLAAAGHRVPRRQHGPAGLTAREVEVLKLLALGLSNKQIAARLVVAPKTVGNHIEHICSKIGVTSRAAAGLFAMQQGLLPEEGFPSSS